MNRIQNLVRRPAGHPRNLRHTPGTFSLPFSSIWRHPSTASSLRLPGVLALCRSWVLMTGLALQALGRTPDKASPPIAMLLKWVSQWEKRDLCWQIFVGICVGLIFSAIANGLE